MTVAAPEIQERAFTCADCGVIAVPSTVWRKLAAEVREAAKGLGYTESRTRGLCRRCQDARPPEATPPFLFDLPEGRYDEHGKYVPACAQEPEAWFPQKGQQKIAERAKAVCAVCPLREACLDMAMDAEAGSDDNMRHGIFGGLTPTQRHKLARQQNRKGLTRGWVTLFCRHGHPRDAYYDRDIQGCHACYCISEGIPVETLAERRLRIKDRELRGEVTRVASYSMTGKYAPKKGTGGFTGHGEAFERRRKTA